jgi:ribosomal protein S18 acetylase RimI-like enzyme
VRYREATSADIEGIALLHATSWRYAYRGSYSDAYLDGPVSEDRRQVWTERLTNPAPNQHVIVAEEEGEVVGLACSYGESDAQWGALLDNLHVHPDRHRKGFGRQLMIETMRWSAAAYPGRGLFLWVLEKNARAQAFYENIGGIRKDSEESQEPGGGTVVGLRYVWPAELVAEIAANRS